MASDFTRGIKVYLDGSGFGKGIKEVQESTAKYREELQKLEAAGKSESKESDKLRRQIEKNLKTEEKYQKGLEETKRVLENLSGASYKELIMARNRVKEQLKTMTRGTKEYNDLLRVLQRTEVEVTAASNAMNASAMTGQGVFTRLASFLHKYLVILTGVGAGLAGAIAAGRKAVSAYAEMDDVMANVMKYTGMTKDEVVDLNESLKAMDTRTAREALNGLAADAGRLGIKGKKDILEFVDAADKINVALGEDLGDDAVKNIGKLAQMFGEDDRLGLRGAMLATGSAVNELAQNSSAAEQYIVEFTARVAGMSNQAGIAQSAIMGYASALDQNMQQVEMSATAFQSLVTAMVKAPEKFAAIAGKPVQEFADLIRNDANEAVLQLLESLRARGGFSELAPIFDEMHLSGQRAIGVLSTLATKVDDVRAAQALANQAYEDGTSVINEFNVQNNTVQASMDKAKKRLQDIRIELGEQIRPLMSKIVTTGSLTVKGLAKLVTFTIKYRATIVATTIALAAYYAWVNRAVVADKLKVFWTDTLTASFKKLWATIKANPIGAVLTALTIGITLLKNWSDNVKKARQEQEALNNAKQKAVNDAKAEAQHMRALLDIAKDEAVTKEQRMSAINQIKDASGGYLDFLVAEKVKTEELTEAVNDYLSLVENARMAESLQQRLDEVGETLDALADKYKNPGFWGKAQDFFDTGGKGVSTARTYRYTTKRDPLVEEQKQINEQLTQLITERTAILARLEGRKGKSGSKPSVTEDGGGSGTADAKSAADLVKEKYDAMLEAAEEGHDAITDNLKAELARRNITQAQYDVASSAENQRYYAERLTIDKDYYKELEQTTYDKEEKRASDLKAVHKATLKDERALQEARLKDLDAYYKSLDAMQKMAAKDEQDPIRKLQLEKDAELAVLDGYYKASLDYARAHGMDETAIEEAYQQALTAIDEKYAEKRTDNAEKEEDKKRQARQKFGMQTIRQQYEEDLALLEQYHNQGLLSDKEYYRAKLMLGAQYWTDMANMYADYFADTVTALQDAEIAVSEAKYDILVSQAQAAGQDTAAIETEKANATLEIQKKYADANFAAKASQIIADTAVAIMKAYADLGLEAGSVAAAMLAVTGAAQLSTANAERKKVKQLSLQSSSPASGGTAERVVQHAAGRYDVIGEEDGRRYSVPYIGAAPTGIVRSPALISETGAELIVNADDLRRLRRHINYPLVVDAINDARRGVVPQYASGNYPLPSSTPANIKDETVATLQRIAALIEKLPTNLRCHIVLSDIDRARDLEQRSRRPFRRGDTN